MIFISHSSKNEDLARWWCEEIEHYGIRCWLSERDLSESHSNWENELMQALKSCSKGKRKLKP